MLLPSAVTILMTRVRVGNHRHQPMATTSCIISPCSGRFSSPPSRPQICGVDGRVSPCPLSGSVFSRCLSVIWLPTLVVLSAYQTAWSPSLLLPWEPVFQVKCDKKSNLYATQLLLKLLRQNPEKKYVSECGSQKTGVLKPAGSDH